jgi:hypothetical protein
MECAVSPDLMCMSDTTLKKLNMIEVILQEQTLLQPCQNNKAVSFLTVGKPGEADYPTVARRILALMHLLFDQ